MEGRIGRRTKGKEEEEGGEEIRRRKGTSTVHRLLNIGLSCLFLLPFFGVVKSTMRRTMLIHPLMLRNMEGPPSRPYRNCDALAVEMGNDRAVSITFFSVVDSTPRICPLVNNFNMPLAPRFRFPPGAPLTVASPPLSSRSRGRMSPLPLCSDSRMPAIECL